MPDVDHGRGIGRKISDWSSTARLAARVDHRGASEDARGGDTCSQARG